MATAWMTYTQTTPTNNKIWTWSGWFKIGEITADSHIFQCNPAGYTRVRFTSAAVMAFDGSDTGGSNAFDLVSDRVFRDPAAWYHLVIAFDVTQATPADRVKIYINGTQETSFSTETYPAQDATYPMNLATTPFYIGKHSSAGNYFNGSMSWVQLVDGLALAPTEFGSVDATSGIWKITPTAYATPGANGFCLKMEDRSNLDLDTSSNAHTFTTGGTVTATYDNPSNNFCTMNPLINRSLLTYSNGNNTIAGYGDGYSRGGYGTMAVSASKWYYEFKVNSTVPGNTIMGIGNVAGMLAKSDLRFNPFSSGTGYSYGYKHVSGDKVTAGTESSYGDTWGQNDIMSCAIDLDNNKIYFGKNGTWQDSGDPTSGASGTGAAFTIQSGEDYLPAQQFDNGPTIEFNFGNGFFGTTSTGTTEADDAGIGQFKYDVPAGYYAICTKNIKAYGG